MGGPRGVQTAEGEGETDRPELCTQLAQARHTRPGTEDRLIHFQDLARVFKTELEFFPG